MKRFLSIILILCMIFSLVPMTFAASGMTTVEKAIVETALAYYYKGPAVQYDSYYLGNGGRFISGILRQTNDRTPESSSSDDIHYTVCSAYPWDIYQNTFGDRIVGTQERIDLEPLADHTFASLLSKMGYTEEQLAYEYSLQCIGRNYSFLSGALQGKDGRSVAYFGPSAWDKSGNVTGLSSLTADADALESLMRPGDVITVRPYAVKTVSGATVYTPNGGHTMMYLGNVFDDGVNYVIHSWGSKYDNNGTVGQKGPDGTTIRGFDLLEAAYSWKGSGSGSYVGRNGSIVLTPYSKILGTGATYDAAKSYDYSILRPSANKTEADLTDSALFRLDRPGITITKTASVKPYRDVIVSDEITYTVKIENNTKDTVNSDAIAKGYGAVLPENRNKTYTDLVLTETLPENVYFCYADGNYSLSGQDISWKLPTLAPGASAEVSYTVEVADGRQVISPEGKLTAAGARGFLPTKTLTHEISPQELSASKVSAITASSVSASSAAKRSGTDVAEDVYAAMGYALDIPDGQELADLLLQEVNFPTESALRYKTDFQLAEPAALTGTAKTLREMIVPGFVGGRRLYTADENHVRTNRTRLLQIEESYLEPGDVLVYLNGGRDSGGNFVRSAAIEKTEAYVYLGSGNWAYYADGVFTVTNDPVKTYYGTASSVKQMESDSNSYVCGAKSGSKKFTYSEILHQCFLQDVFFLMRPARVGLTSMTATSAAKAVEVQSASGSAWCADLASAVTAAKDGDTVVLHEDLTLPSRQIISKCITLDLNGHTVSGPAGEDTILFNAPGVCTLQNGTVFGTVYGSTSVELRLQDMDLMGRDQVYGTEIPREGCALFLTGNAKAVLERVSIASAYGSKAPVQSKRVWDDYSCITVVDDVKIMVPADAIWDPSTMVLGENVKAYTGQGRSLDGKTKSDAYTCLTLTASPDVKNETTGETYASLSEAIRTVRHGETLRLLRDVDTTEYDEVGQNYDSSTGTTKYMYFSSKTVTLDLDGHTITDTVSANGTFMLRDDSSVSGISTFTAKNGRVDSCVIAFAGGQMILEDLHIRADKAAVYHSTAGADGQTSSVTNCAIVSGFGGQDSGNAVSSAKGSIHVRDSLLVSLNREPLAAGTGSDAIPGTVTLENTKLLTAVYVYNTLGTFVKGAHAANHIGPAEGCGLTSSMQMTTYTVDGKAMPFLMDTYGVTDPVAAVNGVGYTSVERALAAAQSGDAVVLQKAASMQSAVTVPEGVSLQVGEHTLTLQETAAMTVAGTVTAEGGEVAAAPEQVKLEGKGSYLGITIPKGVDGTVYADPALQAELSFRVEGNLSLTGTVSDAYTHVKVLDSATGETLAAGSEFSLGSVAAKELGKTFTPVLTSAVDGGVLVGPVQEVCLRSLAEKALQKTDWQTAAPAGKALVALLNYGAAAQTYFGFETENLANANISAYQSYLDVDVSPYGRDESTLTGTKKELLLGTSCLLEEDLRMKIYVAEGASFSVTFAGKTYEDLTGSFTVENILQYAPNAPITVTVYENGIAVAQGTDSLSSYLARLSASQPQLAKAILTYAAAIHSLS